MTGREKLLAAFTPEGTPEIGVVTAYDSIFLRQCTEAIRENGMKSIYYYCGNPWTRLEAILEAGADAVHFEEGKKGFSVRIEDVVGAVGRRCVLFGNLDAIGVLQDGSEDMLRSEIRRQLHAGSLNGNRFIVSTGSPITPGTPVRRVRHYTDMVRKLAGGVKQCNPS